MSAEHHVPTPRGALYAKSWNDAAPRAPIVLFHDSLGCVALWREFPAALAAATGRRVIAYDRLGFGKSDPNPDRLPNDFVLAEARTALPALRDALGVERFVAFGHSVGGGMAIACAAALPAACVALVTDAAQAFVEDRTLDGIRAARESFAQPGQFERLHRYHGTKAQWVFRAWVDTWLAPEFARWTLDDVLPHVRCPVLAMHGDRDEFGSAAHPRRIVERVRGPATLALLEDCGHVPHRERESDILARVAAHLDALA